MLNPDDDPQPALEGLKRASGFLRSKLGAALMVRHVPELRFQHDDSIAHGAEISRLIDFHAIGRARLRMIHIRDNAAVA